MFFYPLDKCINRVMRLVVLGGVGGYDIMVYEGALYVPHSGDFLVLAECVVELCVVLVLVHCHFMYSSRSVLLYCI